MPRLLATLAATAAVALTASAALLAPAHAAGPATGAVTATKTVVVRPVDASGKPAAGWTVKKEKDGAVSCDGASPAAVDDDIVICYPTADYLPACWPSSHHTVLCLRDARKHVLARVHYQGSIKPATAPKQASPLDLVLGNGEHCDLRIGGAWGVLPSHKNWVGFASCTKGSIYGPGNGDGVDRSTARWTVHEWRSHTKSTVVRRGIRTAYVVGTAS